jgi:hypothetical protein
MLLLLFARVFLIVFGFVSCTTLETKKLYAKPISDALDELPKGESPFLFEIFKNDLLSYVPIEGAVGGKALKLTVLPNQIVGKGSRAQIVFLDADSHGQEGWYRWRFQIPTEYQDDNKGRRQTIAEWKKKPEPASANYKENISAIRFDYGNREDMHRVTFSYGTGDKNHKVNSKKVQKGVWYTLTVHLLLSVAPAGFAEVWLNDSAMTPFNGKDNRYYGSNMYTLDPVSLKIGLDRDATIETTNFIFLDAFRRGPNRKFIEKSF